jgi:hypothetical protein
MDDYRSSTEGGREIRVVGLTHLVVIDDLPCSRVPDLDANPVRAVTA